MTAESEAIRLTEARRDLERTVDEQETATKVLMNRDPFDPVASRRASFPSTRTCPSRGCGLALARQPGGADGAGEGLPPRRRSGAGAARVDSRPDLQRGAQRYNDSSQAVSEVDRRSLV